MNAYEDRAKIEGLVQWLHPDNPDCKLDVSKIHLVLAKIQIQVLLDIRDSLSQMVKGQGVQKWGPKIPQEQDIAPDVGN